MSPAIVSAAWEEEAKLLASDGAAGDLLGWAVAVSGDTAVAGAPPVTVDGHPQQGAAYVFTRDTDVWMEQAKLSASDGSAGDWLGYSVALSGDVALLGAPNANGAGAVYVFTRSGETWAEQGKLTASDGAPGAQFGFSIALSGDTALVGAVDAVVGGNASQGAAYVFIHSEGQWIEQDKLIASDGAEGDAFGVSVALSGSTALIGALGAMDNTGAAYVFTHDGETWGEQAQLHATDGAPGDGFGESVALSGDTALVGARGAQETQGAAYVFTRSGQTWSEQAKLTAIEGAPAPGGEHFGSAVALSGDTALVGALFTDSVRGAVYVFGRIGESWIEQIRLTASDAMGIDQFGLSVGISGDTALMGAPGVRDADGNFAMGAAYAFVLEPGSGPPTIAVEPESLSASPVEGQAELHTLTIFNLGAETLEWEVSEGEGCSLPTWVDVAPSNGTVPDGTSQVLGVTFDSAGLDPGDYTADLCISSNDSEQPLLIVPLALTAAGGNPELTFIPASLDFGEVDVGATSPSQPVLLFNSGDAEITGITFDLPGGGFEADTSFCGTVLPVGQGCGAILVTFAPQELGPAEAVLAVTSDQGASASLDLTGEGVPPPPQIQVDPDSLDVTLPLGDATTEILTITNGGGEDLEWEVVEQPDLSGLAAFGDVTTITHSASMDIAPDNNLGCSFDGGETTVATQFLRTFTLEDFDIAHDFEIVEVVFGVQTATAATTVALNLYTLEGEFTYPNLTPIGSVAVDVPVTELGLQTVPISATVPAGATFVVEIAAPNLFVSAFVAGSNTLGETAPSYFASTLCGLPQPVPYGDIGLPQVHLVMAVSGIVLVPPDCERPDWLATDPLAGVVAPGGSEPMDVTFDAGGLTPGDYEATLCISSNDPERLLTTVPLALTVTGGAELTFDPTSLDFGDVEVGSTSDAQFATLSNTGDTDATGLVFTDPGNGFVADTSGCGDNLPAGASCPVSITFTPAELGPASATLQAASNEGAFAGLDLAGTGVSDGVVTPVALQADAEALLSDGNQVFEPGELVVVAPAWRNDGLFGASLTGTASGFNGPDRASYLLPLDGADYGNLEPATTASCLDTGICYWMGVNDPSVRPATHWEAAFDETLSDGTTHTWSLHIGDSFLDVPRANPFYPAVETLLHNGVTGGCTTAEYCPAGTNTRGQMAVFLLKAADGADYTPPACVEDEAVFADVPFDSPFCPWIEELAGRQITSGCGGGNYCPSDSVTRAQMAVFLLKAAEGSDYTPPECTGAFSDVTCPSTFAAWIEELAARGITGGCSADPPAYCPAAPVTRAQMAVFVTKTFDLALYGP